MIYTNLSDENRAFLATPRPNYPGLVTHRSAYMNDDEAEYDGQARPAQRCFRYGREKKWAKVGDGFPWYGDRPSTSRAVAGEPLVFNAEYFIPGNVNMAMIGIGTIRYGSLDAANHALAEYLFRGIRYAQHKGVSWVGAYNWFPCQRLHNPYCAAVLDALDVYMPALYIAGRNAVVKRWDIGPGFDHAGVEKISHGYPDKPYVPVISLNYNGQDTGPGSILTGGDFNETLRTCRDHYRAADLYLWCEPTISRQSLEVGGHLLANAMLMMGMDPRAGEVAGVVE